jgi:hypothetical protein
LAICSMLSVLDSSLSARTSCSVQDRLLGRSMPCAFFGARCGASRNCCARALTAARSRPSSMAISKNGVREASSRKRLSSSGVQCLCLFCAMVVYARALLVDHNSEALRCVQTAAGISPEGATASGLPRTRDGWNAKNEGRHTAGCARPSRFGEEAGRVSGPSRRNQPCGF